MALHSVHLLLPQSYYDPAQKQNWTHHQRVAIKTICMHVTLKTSWFVEKSVVVVIDLKVKVLIKVTSN